jgi:hypothetical protein
MSRSSSSSRSNSAIIVLASAARTADTNSSDFSNFGASGIHVIIDVTVDPASASVTFTLQGKDEASGNYYTILTSSAIVGTGTTVLRVLPSVAASANVSVSDGLPAVWRINANHVDTDSITYSVGANLLV